jgi:PAS domain S-box-containing protein
MEKSRILIIDDDATLRKTLADILRVKGYETRAAKNGAEGLVLLSQDRADIALIDLNLPDMTGMEVLDSIKAGHPGTEAIILTGNATLGSAIEATNKGAYSYLTKPYEIEQLLIQIRRALEKQGAEQALRESESKFRDLSEKSLSGIYLIQNETFAYVNPRLAEIFGYTVDEIVDKKGPADLTSQEDRQLVLENLRRRLADEAESVHYEFKGKQKNGSIVFIEAYGSKTTYLGKRRSSARCWILASANAMNKNGNN